jgi:hypothetical protein
MQRLFWRRSATCAALGSTRRLVGYLGLDPRVRQSGPGPAKHGRISKQGSAPARYALVEAAWSVVRQPGPLRAFYQRVRGHQVAIVASARKLACLFWCLLTREQDYAYAQPSLTKKKLRRLEARRRRPPKARSSPGSGPLTPPSARQSASSPAKASSPTSAPSPTGKQRRKAASRPEPPFVLFICQDDTERDDFLARADHELTGHHWRPTHTPLTSTNTSAVATSSFATNATPTSVSCTRADCPRTRPATPPG